MKLKITATKLFSKCKYDDLSAAIGEFDIVIVDNLDKEIGSTKVSFHGKIGTKDSSGGYTRYYDIVTK